MPIEVIDRECCTGCGICFACCPQDVFRMEENTRKPVIQYPEDCVACWSCELFCPADCIQVSRGRKRELPLPY